MGNPNGWTNNKEKAQIARRAEWLLSNDVIKVKNIIQLMNKDEGVSLSEIARNLNMHGIKTQRGSIWYPNQVKLLVNQIEK